MPAFNIPAAEHPIDGELVRALLAQQHPDLAGLPIERCQSGWDNVLFRLGPDLTVRLPRHRAAAQRVEHELRWVPELAPRLPLPIAAPVRAGAPGLGYPFPWSIGPWFLGDDAANTPPADEARAAATLGAFLVALHTPAPPGAPTHSHRGIPLAERTPHFERSLEQLDDVLDPTTRRELAALFFELAASEPWPLPPSWLHGDLHPANLLVREGELAAVLDFGDVCAGDPATDFAVAWMLFSPGVHDAFFRAAGRAHDAHLQRRAKAWAIAIGTTALAHSADDARIRALAIRTLERSLARPLSLSP